MAQPEHYSFTRYLTAKRTVDDRALNHHVRQALAHELSEWGPDDPRRDNPEPDPPAAVLEIGAGAGTMIERILGWEMICAADYTAVDFSAENLAEAARRLPQWAVKNGYHCFFRDDSLPVTAQAQAKAGASIASDLLIANESHTFDVHLKEIDLFDFIAGEQSRRWDLLIAHAFLDLIDIPASLPSLFSLVQPGGLFYFTINFDGETIFEPVIDRALDETIIQLYHRSMDERVVEGRPSGDSRSGRHLFTQLPAAGADILAAGASDWVVYPSHGAYPADEAYFMHFMVHTLHNALSGHPDLDCERFERWIDLRHTQIERGELIYLAHQLDFLGRTRA